MSDVQGDRNILPGSQTWGSTGIRPDFPVSSTGDGGPGKDAAGSSGQQEPAPDPAGEEIVFLEPGKEQAQNIARAMSHQNAGDIMALLSTEGPMRLSDIADRMALSTNAAKYHVENLMGAGLVEISNTRYSVKGKKVKIYRLKNQIFVMAPSGRTSAPAVREALLKFATLCGLFIVAFAFFFVQPFVSLSSGPVSPVSGSLQQGAVMPAADSSALVPALILAVFATLLVFAGFEIFEYWKRRERSSS